MVGIAYSSSIDDLQWCTRRLRAISRERIIDRTPSALGFNAEVTTDHTCLDRAHYSSLGGHLAAEGSAACEWQRVRGGGDEEKIRDKCLFEKESAEMPTCGRRLRRRGPNDVGANMATEYRIVLETGNSPKILKPRKRRREGFLGEMVVVREQGEVADRDRLV
ncbi:hypothetical protein R3P38DRAFT_2799626 [Favolaschia claudopus]|uniref:Uncharacterized protein n=1 Tax=Favolaschia claudopus TaxID=2862362 RepID=A0AAV9ZZQ3_9AGAR